MKATYRISEDDYVNATKLSAKLPQIQVVIFSIVTVVLLGLAALIPSLIGVKAGIIGGLSGGILSGVLTIYVTRPMLARRQYKKYKLLHGEFSVELIEEGLLLTSDNGNTKLEWENISKWRQDDKYILLYPMSTLFYMLPKSIHKKGFDLPHLISLLLLSVGKPT